MGRGLNELSSIEDFRNKMLENAKRRAEEIIRSGEEEARKIVEEAESKWRRMFEEERSKIINEARRRAELILSEARRRARLILTQAKQELMNEIFTTAYSRIKSRSGVDVKKSLENLLNEALMFVETPSKIIVNPRDKGIMEDLIKSMMLSNVTIETSEEVDGGLILVSKEGEVVDNTYRTRLTRAYESIVPIIVKKTWGKS